VEASGNLLIFGASARAAAFSALRAGLRPWCADLFADADLAARCPAVRLPGRYPHGFLDLTDAPAGPWLYTGGLENWPGLVARLARRRPLWGNGPAALREARDPSRLARALRNAGLPAPAVRRSAPCPCGPCRWLVKPLRGAGGAGVRFWDGETPSSGSVYWQQFVPGEGCAAAYLGDGRKARLLGLTRQLVGLDWLHADAFRYCGSVGPLRAEGDLLRLLERLGDVLAGHCGLRGLFGVDGVLNDEGFWPVEVNPRYPASVEVLEYATGLRALAWHGLAFTAGGTAEGLPPVPPADGVVGKAVLYAREDFRFPADGPWAGVLRAPPPPPADELPAFADLPHAGDPGERGRPVLTLFARAADPGQCLAELRRTAAELDRWLYGERALNSPRRGPAGG
jgi:predicted ATP-grasp superfamily ATP-dependent carboligase